MCIDNHIVQINFLSFIWIFIDTNKEGGKNIRQKNNNSNNNKISCLRTRIKQDLVEKKKLCSLKSIVTNLQFNSQIIASPPSKVIYLERISILAICTCTRYGTLFVSPLLQMFHFWLIRQSFSSLAIFIKESIPWRNH